MIAENMRFHLKVIKLYHVRKTNMSVDLHKCVASFGIQRKIRKNFLLGKLSFLLALFGTTDAIHVKFRMAVSRKNVAQKFVTQIQKPKKHFVLRKKVKPI